ncbi:DMT family transporter [Swaminathania salitolerans]|nr:multidrug efflux SMR transporter [Swaminathania salitolerans]GBQ15383.1 small multidrug resistance protein [Swaminathania salitolerans LMG 21291]
MPWIVLLIAGLCEVVWATSMKQSAGFTRFWPGLISIVTMILSGFLLSWSMKTLPLGTAYTVWTGIGAVGAFLVGIIWLGEELSPGRLGAALLILTGIGLMKFAT